MSTQRSTPIEAIFKRDQVVVLAGLALIAALAWAYVVYLAQQPGMQGMAMDDMAMDMAMPSIAAWGPFDFAAMFVMWSVMMVAMMVPAAAPMVLVFARVNRNRREQDRPYVPTSVFVLGYVVVWSAFSLLATLSNWGLHAGGLLSSMMGESTSAYLGGALLLAAGIYQWTPLKYACLTQCRTPLGFIMTQWRDGMGGALQMGLKHGLYCLGCCWVLMALLFVLGIMNLAWIAALAVVVLLEKVAPGGLWISRAAGLIFIGWAALMFAGAFGVYTLPEFW
jgi:predicted metal-binding membrane protein